MKKNKVIIAFAVLLTVVPAAISLFHVIQIELKRVKNPLISQLINSSSSTAIYYELPKTKLHSVGTMRTQSSVNNAAQYYSANAIAYPSEQSFSPIVPLSSTQSVMYIGGGRSGNTYASTYTSSQRQTQSSSVPIMPLYTRALTAPRVTTTGTLSASQISEETTAQLLTNHQRTILPPSTDGSGQIGVVQPIGDAVLPLLLLALGLVIRKRVGYRL